MPRYRKRPLVVEACQYAPGRPCPGVFMHRPEDVVFHSRAGGSQSFPQDPYPAVKTAQGQIVRVAPGEWVIAEPDGRGYYPCADDVFRATYEPAG